MSRTALLVVDMLTDFLAPKPGLETPTAIASLIENNKNVCRFARRADIPVVFVNDAFQKTEIPIDRHFKLSIPHAIIGTKEALVIDELEYDEKVDFIVEKKLYDGFYNTRLDSIWPGTGREERRGHRYLDKRLCAAYDHGCVCRGYDDTILEDCCSCPDEGEHEHALAYMKKFYGANAVSSSAWDEHV